MLYQHQLISTPSFASFSNAAVQTQHICRAPRSGQFTRISGGTDSGMSVWGAARRGFTEGFLLQLPRARFSLALSEVPRFTPNPPREVEGRGNPHTGSAEELQVLQRKHLRSFLSCLSPSPTSHGLESGNRSGPSQFLLSTHLVFAGVLHDLRAQVAALDGAQVLLVALAVAGVFVQHVRRAGLRLRLDDGVPELLGLHHPADTALPLVTATGNRRFSECQEQRGKTIVCNTGSLAGTTPLASELHEC